ncbi:MAG: hypothetical protein V9E98_05540 [Candidatus Nanopelagicales bacterium]
MTSELLAATCATLEAGTECAVGRPAASALVCEQVCRHDVGAGEQAGAFAGMLLAERQHHIDGTGRDPGLARPQADGRRLFPARGPMSATLLVEHSREVVRVVVERHQSNGEPGLSVEVGCQMPTPTDLGAHLPPAAAHADIA